MRSFRLSVLHPTILFDIAGSQPTETLVRLSWAF